jgi:hypothetical protein
MNKSKNQNDTSLNSTMKVINETSSKIQTTSWMFGVLVTSLKNHRHGITKLCKIGEFGVLQKPRGITCAIHEEDANN